MYLPSINRRPSRFGHAAVPLRVGFGVLLLAVTLGVTACLAQFPVRDRVDVGDSGAESGVYLPTDRSLSRAMIRARERLGEREYHQALTFLQDVLARNEDSFLEQANGDPEQQGLKAAARRLIGELPPDGHDAYELLHSAAARRQLESALAAGDQEGVAQVVRQFYHTSVGYEAALVLAQMEADHGHHLAAAQLYQELLETPRAAAQFEPQLSLMAAVNFLVMGQEEQASSTLRALIERNPSAAVKLLGRSDTLPAVQADPLMWLRDVVGRPVKTERGALDWLTHRGDAARNVRPHGGPPHLRARWEARVVNDPTVEAYLTGKAEQFARRGVAAIPSARPIAAGGVVLMRTPNNVVAIDWHTGKRIWETREDEELVVSDLPPGFVTGDPSEDLATQGNELEQRIWEDSLETSLASDGERVFLIRSRAVSPQDGQQSAILGGNQFIGGETIPSANKLAAFDLATQGKLLWEIDGNSSAGPLAGAFFLGAPLAIDNTLLVMAEVRSAIYVVALEPATGQVEWQQQLIGLEQGITLDPGRRLIGATPSYSGGILVCPTSAGAVVAIDVVKRELAWVYRYPRQSPAPTDMRQFLQAQVQSPSLRANNRWRDSSAIIADGRVFVTPPDSLELHCLDLRTGKTIWKDRQGGAMFVACVDQDRVLLVGKDSLRALRAADKSPAWNEEFVALPAGSLPAGQGYLSGQHYYLPVTTGGVVVVDLAKGELLPYSADNGAPVLGNLICYRGSVLSQTALVLDRFEQSDVLRQRAEAALAKNPKDAAALGELAEMRRAEGQIAEAVALLKRAIALTPDDPIARELLAEVLLDALAADFASYRDDVPLLRRVIQGRNQEIELLRIEAQGLDELGQRLPAFAAYLRLADYTAEAPAQLRLSAEYSVRSDRWVGGQLGRLWSAATEEERAAIAADLKARRPPADQTPSAAELRHYLAHFGQLPGADEVRLRLARWLVDRGHAREAEIEILAMGASSDEGAQAAAAVLLTQLAVAAGTPAETTPIAALLAGRWKNVKSLDGLTGREWLERLTQEMPRLIDTEAGAWPSGHVDAKVNRLASPSRDRADQRGSQERLPGLRRLNIEQSSWPGIETVQWFVSTEERELIGRDGTGNEVFRLAVEANGAGQQNRDTNFAHAARLGHLLIVSIGGQILAIDSRQSSRGAESSVLWQAYPLGRFPANSTSLLKTNSGQRVIVYDSSSGRRRSSGASGRAVGSLGPATASGVVFQEQDELKCVDPLSGETLWKRGDVPAGCELFGDQELVFATDANERAVRVFHMSDGRPAGTRPLPEFPWMLTAGRNVAQCDIRGMANDRKRHLRVTNIETGDVLFDAEYDDLAKIAVVEPQAIAIYEPAGKFQLVDVRTGEVRIDQQLEALLELQDIRTLVSGDQLFLMVNARSLLKQYGPIGPVDFPMINGRVYAFDMKSGEALWPGPALVRNRALMLGQPEDIPLLVFIDRKSTRDRNTGGGSQIRLLCLDKRTGQTVYRNDELPDTAPTRLRVRAEQGAEPKVAIEMSAAEIHLTMTDRPRPPQPPGNDELEIPRASTERGLWGVAGRMSEALQNALEKQPGNAPNDPGANEPDGQPADIADLDETDDD